MKRVFRRPSPAMVVAIIALITALAGTAVAGGLLTKKKVNQIITNRAPGLSVAKAKSADTATSAGTAGTAGTVNDGAITNAKVAAGTLSADRISAQGQIDLRGALAYAQVNDIGDQLVPARTSGFTAVTNPSTGVWCLTVAANIANKVFDGAGSPIRPTVAAPEFGNTTGQEDVTVLGRGANTTCGPNLLEVRTYDGAALADNVAFFVIVP